MNIKKMLQAQKELDQANFDKARITEYPLEEVKIAYKVELGEALQEAKFWKYWKKSKGEVDREKLLEELADCLHFALSLENWNVEEFGSVCSNDYYNENINEELRGTIYNILEDCFNSDEEDDIPWVLENTIRLGIKLGFTLEELEQAYWDKNKINWDRVKGDY